MRRTAAGIAATLFATLVLGGPLASSGAAAGTTLKCAVATPPAACALLDDLAAQLAPAAPLLGPSLAGLTGSAQDLAARSDQPAGVPTAEVTMISSSLLAQLDGLPSAVRTLLGATALADLTGTLEALVAQLAAPATGGQQAAGSSQPTPAKTTTPAATPTAPRSNSTTSFGGAASTSSSTGSGSAPSSASVPAVPVGDPLSLAPLALPDFGFSESFEPVVEATPAVAPIDAEVALAEALDTLPDQGRGAELVVVAVLSLLLIAGAGIAQLQQSRHTIQD